MAHNLSSNQQYLLSMVQQNNPEILSKFLNEERTDKARVHSDPYDAGISDEQRARWAARDKAAAEAKEKAKNDPYGAVRMAKARRGEVSADPDEAAEQQRRLAYADKKQAKMDELNRAHYAELLTRTADMDPEKMDAKTAGQLLMYKIQTGQNKKTPEQQMRDIAMGGNLEKSDEQKNREEELRISTDVAADPGTFGERFKNMSADEIGSIAARAAKREADEIADNKAISPFYRTTRKQFRDEFGRDFDASGGATPENMRGLVNIKTNLAGRLQDIETGWQDKTAWNAQLKAAEPFDKRIDPNSKEFYKQQKEKMDATWKAKGKAEFENPVHTYRARDFDVPGLVQPGEQRGDSRTLPSQPVNTDRTTEWIDRGMHDSLRTQWNDPSQREIMRGQGFNPDSMLNTPVEGGGEMRIDWTKGPGCQGPFCQASNLSGKSVNQKINRIA
jgi:hypothetical protein